MRSELAELKANLDRLQGECLAVKAGEVSRADAGAEDVHA